ncbi:MAG: hypothetical protein AAGC55_28590 [Myxococcota bacterium]
MKCKPSIYRYLLITGLTLSAAACSGDDDTDPVLDTSDDPLIAEAQLLLQANADRMGITPGELSGTTDPDRFTPEQNVFLTSVIAVSNLDDPDAAVATLPLYEGVRPNGKIAHYILTEAADFDVARVMGLNYAPRMIFGKGTAGAMEVQIDDQGRLVFPGDVDFWPERFVEAGVADDPDLAFPPNPDTLQPGAVADADWSSLVVTPAGNVFNVQQVRNDTGDHDRVVAIDADETEVTLQLLDGFQGGEQFYYHLVTDASDPAPAAIELGVYAPRLANLPDFGASMVNSESALLGFSPVVNGITGVGSDQRQGLGSTLVDLIPGTQIPIDPINICPLDPDNSLQTCNNYSPMWDAHLSMWTDEAINGPDGDQRRRITSLADLQSSYQIALQVTASRGSSTLFDFLR